MAKTRWLNIAIWALVTLCVAFGVGAAVAYGRLRVEVATLRREATALRTEVMALESEAAALKANKAITRTAFTDLQYLLRQPKETPQQTCQKIRDVHKILVNDLSSAQRQALGDASSRLLTLTDNSCSTREGGLLSPDYAATRAFVDAYIDAVDARVAGQYDAALGHYDRALATPNAQTVDAQWRMRALEGAADALAHKRDLAGAQTRLNQLRTVREAYNARWGTDYRFVFEDTANLKLQCLRREPAASVVARLAAIRADYDAYAKSRPTAATRAFAAGDRQFIEDDAELWGFCAYALRPPAT